MNPILRHTLASKTAQRAASYVSSPLRRIGAGPRAMGLQPDMGSGGA